MKVINAPFRVEPVPSNEVPLWKQPELIDLLRAAAAPAGLALVALLVFFGLVRPAVKSAFATRPATPGQPPALAAVVDDTQVLPALPAPKSNEHLNGARALARQNPAAVAGIVRGWVSGEAA